MKFLPFSNKDKFLRFPARPPMSGAGGLAAWSNFFAVLQVVVPLYLQITASSTYGLSWDLFHSDGLSH
jgi:hypothetical protein